MKFKPTLLVPFVLFLLGFGFVLNANEPIFDLSAKGYELSDSSSYERVAEWKGIEWEPGGNGVEFRSTFAITVPFAPDDPLFERGSRTWIMRFKIHKVHYRVPYSIAGRWEYKEDKRVMALSIDGRNGHSRLQVSGSGKMDSERVACILQYEIPEGEWITLVGRYDVGRELVLEAYNESGDLMDSQTGRSGIPDELFEASVPFVIGAPKEVGMVFSRFRAWDEFLSNSEIKTVLSER